MSPQHASTAHTTNSSSVSCPKSQTDSTGKVRQDFHTVKKQGKFNPAKPIARVQVLEKVGKGKFQKSYNHRIVYDLKSLPPVTQSEKSLFVTGTKIRNIAPKANNVRLVSVAQSQAKLIATAPAGRYQRISTQTSETSVSNSRLSSAGAAFVKRVLKRQAAARKCSSRGRDLTAVAGSRKRPAEDRKEPTEKKARNTDQQAAAEESEEQQCTSPVSQEKVRAALSQLLVDKQKSQQQPQTKFKAPRRLPTTEFEQSLYRHDLLVAKQTEQPHLKLTQARYQLLQQLKQRFSTPKVELKADLVQQLCDIWSRGKFQSTASVKKVTEQIPAEQRQQYEIAAYQKYVQYVI